MWDSLPGTALFSIQSSCFLCIPGFANTSQTRLLPQDHWLAHLEAGFNHHNHFDWWTPKHVSGFSSREAHVDSLAHPPLISFVLKSVGAAFTLRPPVASLWCPRGPALGTGKWATCSLRIPSAMPHLRSHSDEQPWQSPKALCCFMAPKILSQTPLYFESHAIDWPCHLRQMLSLAHECLTTLYMEQLDLSEITRRLVGRRGIESVPFPFRHMASRYELAFGRPLMGIWTRPLSPSSAARYWRSLPPSHSARGATRPPEFRLACCTRAPTL